jgi:hypothetical protein
MQGEGAMTDLSMAIDNDIMQSQTVEDAAASIIVPDLCVRVDQIGPALDAEGNVTLQNQVF